MKRNIGIIKKRKKVWDLFGWGYLSQPGRLFKNHWLTCGCRMCVAAANIQKQEIRKARHISKLEINKELERMINNET